MYHPTSTRFAALVAGLLFVLVFSACKKDEREPPSLAFKTTAGYTFADVTVGTSDSLLVGIDATKTEDELNTLNVSYQFDGGASTTKDNFTLTGANEEHYVADYQIVTRATAGTEKWSFTVTDRDGNVTTKSITLTVQ